LVNGAVNFLPLKGSSLQGFSSMIYLKGARRAGMKCLAVTNSHPAELLSEATAIVKSLEDVNSNFLRKMCA